MEHETAELCPKCKTTGETTIHEYETMPGTAIDIGWKCPKCGHEWGFEINEPLPDNFRRIPPLSYPRD